MAIARLTQEQAEKTKDVTHKLAEKVVGYVGRTFMDQDQMTKEDIEQIIYNDMAILIHGLSNATHDGRAIGRTVDGIVGTQVEENTTEVER